MLTLEEIKKQNIQLIGIDLDGTMLNSQKQITKHTKEVFEKAYEAGITIVPATGRHYEAVPKELFEIKGIRYVLSMSGAAIYDYKTNTCIHKDDMPHSLAVHVLHELRRYNILVDAFIGNEALRSEKDMDFVDQLNIPDTMKQFVKHSRKGVPSLDEYIIENQCDVAKYVLNFLPDGKGGCLYRDEVIAKLKSFNELAVVSGGLNNLEITMTSANKGTGLLKLGELLGIDAHQTMAIGDAGNDYDMIKAAAVGVAMQNAEAEILEAADFITKSNDEEGVAYIVEACIIK